MPFWGPWGEINFLFGNPDIEEGAVLYAFYVLIIFFWKNKHILKTISILTIKPFKQLKCGAILDKLMWNRLIMKYFCMHLLVKGICTCCHMEFLKLLKSPWHAHCSIFISDKVQLVSVSDKIILLLKCMFVSQYYTKLSIVKLGLYSQC